MIAPIRAYLRFSPIPRGKGRLVEWFLRPMLQLAMTHRSFVWTTPTRARISLRYCEDLGLRVLAFGGFENAEIVALASRLQPGVVAMDIGANVGIFAASLGRAQAAACVYAIEPYKPNLSRLRANICLNDLANVTVLPVAASDVDGSARLRVADDPAYSSISAGPDRSVDVIVETRRLDSVWAELGLPKIGVVKIDVEGAELAVLRGAIGLLTRDSPVILVETTSRLPDVRKLLGDLGYSGSQPRGFDSWNHLFERTSLEHSVHASEGSTGLSTRQFRPPAGWVRFRQS